jgi:hypothetical protein
MVPASAGELLLPLLRLCGVFALFVLPGYAWATCLLGGRRRGAAIDPEGTAATYLPWFGRCTLGFVISFALFSLLSWPFLWYGRSFAALMAALRPAWLAYGALGAVAFLLTLLSTRPSETVTAGGSGTQPLDKSALDALQLGRPGSERRPALLAPLRCWPVLRSSAYLLFCIGVVYAYYVLSYIGPVRLVGLAALPLLAWRGVLVVRQLPARCRESLAELDRPEDSLRPPRRWIIAAVVAVAVQVALVAVCNRPDWDDCYYLAAVVDYQHADKLNAEEPTHREGLPVPTQHRTLCWELWGAVLCHLTGLSALSLFHTFLPILMALLLYGGYASLLAELVPRRYVPLSLILLSGLHLWGSSSHIVATNFVLPRLGQGKAVLLHLAIPMCITLLLKYAARPGPRGFRSLIALLATLLFSIGVSLSALFLVPALVICLAGALAWQAERMSARLQILVGAGLTTTPIVIAGLAMRHALRNEAAIHTQPIGFGHWLETIANYLGRGSVEVLWLLTLPFAALLLRDRRARAYLLFFPASLLATFLNPLLFHPVARTLTSYHTYSRLLWLLPVVPGLAVLLTLFARWLHAELGALAGARGARYGLLGLVLGITGATFLLPGIFVFGPANDFIGPLGRPSLADNVEKIPGDLMPIAARVLADPDIQNQRILCNEAIASFLTPYSARFRFVQTRLLYTPVLFFGGGRIQEGIERTLLADILRRGVLPPFRDYDELRDLYLTFGPAAVAASFGPAIAAATRDAGTLLRRYHVRYVILIAEDKGLPLLQQQGYRIELSSGRFTLLSAPQ